MKRKVPETMAACFDLIEREMFEGPWVLGESYSVCDPYLFTMARWLDRDGVDIARFPNVADHPDRMAGRPAVAKVLAARPVESRPDPRRPRRGGGSGGRGVGKEGVR